MSRRIVTILVVAMALVAGACGDDDEEADDVQAYCDYSASLDEGEGLPSDDQLDRLRELAPSEIEDEVEVAADGIAENGEQAFEDPEVLEAFEAIEAFEERECGREDVEPGGEGGNPDEPSDDTVDDDTDTTPDDNGTDDTGTDDTDVTTED